MMEAAPYDFICTLCDRQSLSGGHPYERWGVCASCARLVTASWHVARSGEIPPEIYEPGDEKLFPYADTPGSVREVVYVKALIPSALRWQVFRRDGYACCRCGSLDDLTADHIDPERAGGMATLANLQTLCRPCNSSKGAR